MERNGGRPKNEKIIETQEKPKRNPRETQEKPKRNLNVNVNVNENVNVKDNIIENIINIYNENCTNLPKVLKQTPKRKKAIKDFNKIYSSEDFKQICQIANDSDFLIGNNDRGWKADFDFLMRIDKATAILEGKYTNNKKKEYQKYEQRQYDKNEFNQLYANYEGE